MILSVTPFLNAPSGHGVIEIDKAAFSAVCLTNNNAFSVVTLKLIRLFIRSARHFNLLNVVLITPRTACG